MDLSVLGKDIRILLEQVDAMNKRFDRFLVMQRNHWETTRKSANSINVIVRLLAGNLKMSANDLGKTLLESDALVDTVKPNMNTDIGNILVENYPIANLKSMLTDLIRIIEQSSVNTANNIPSSSTSLSSLSLANSNTQTEHISPIVTHTFIKSHEISGSHTSQNQNDSTNIDYTDSNDCLIGPVITMHMSSDYLSRKNKEAEEARKLRRQYCNRYKYIHKNKQYSDQIDFKRVIHVVPNENDEILDVDNNIVNPITNITNISEPMSYVPKLVPHILLGKFDHGYNIQKTINKAFNNPKPRLTIKKSNTRNSVVLVNRKIMKSNVQSTTSMISEIKVPSRRNGLNNRVNGNKIKSVQSIKTEKSDVKEEVAGRRNSVNKIFNTNKRKSVQSTKNNNSSTRDVAKPNRRNGLNEIFNTNKGKSGTSVRRSKLATKRPTIKNTNHESPGKRKKVKSNT